MEQLIVFVADLCLKYPEHKDEAYELLQLCKDEIEAGESETHEIELCYGSLIDLINE